MKFLTKPVIYSLYGLSVALIILGLVIMGRGTKLSNVIEPNHAYDILNKVTLPVVKEQDDKIGRPYTDMNVTIAQNYYDYRASEEDQKKSLIYYQDTYIQSTGISYQLEGTSFDAIAILDGEVVEVKEDALLGNTVTIKHSSSVTSVYQSITDITVQKGETVQKGMKIGTSGKSNINADLGNHLYFELIIDNISVNPEEYYDKTL